MRWKALLFINNDPTNKDDLSYTNYGIQSAMCPPQIKEMSLFERDLIKLIKAIKFRDVSNTFQNNMKKDIKAIRLSDKTLIQADKTSNMYKLSKEQYNKLLTNAITATYKKANPKLKDQIIKKGKNILSNHERVVAVVKFLSERGLAFRGHNETFSVPNNSNFMGCLELIAEFDPFLKEHIQKCSGKKHSVSYQTKTVYEEIITLMAKKVTKTIIEEVNSTKYYSIVVDSTPDVALVDQLAIILRYCYQGDVFERFLTITPITSHTGKSLLNVVKTILDTNNLSIKNCRGQ
ncbi:uncharacterized protein LOC136082943 [Hydra vulgaris]|uniref:Uncharacterized protein LOC136082943 n=1 Tax=Hydra vulgaris TaxID=6087 RepID=A0ABM4C9V4_HYDVU